MKKAEKQWETSSRPLLPERTLLQVYKLLTNIHIKFSLCIFDFITSSPLKLFMWDTDSDAQLRNKIFREEAAHQHSQEL